MTVLRNKGGEYRRSTGVLVGPGETFTPGDQELRVLQKMRQVGVGHLTRFEVVEGAPAPKAKVLAKPVAAKPVSAPLIDDDEETTDEETTDEETTDEETTDEETTDEETTDEETTDEETTDEETEAPTLEDWTMKVSPEEYLVGWPSGPKAEMARQILGLPEDGSEDPTRE